LYKAISSVLNYVDVFFYKDYYWTSGSLSTKWGDGSPVSIDFKSTGYPNGWKGIKVGVILSSTGSPFQVVDPETVNYVTFCEEPPNYGKFMECKEIILEMLYLKLSMLYSHLH
jgi:hypothetical protein